MWWRIGDQVIGTALHIIPETCSVITNDEREGVGLGIDSAVLWAVIASSDVVASRPDFNLQASGIIAVLDVHLISLARPFPFRSADSKRSILWNGKGLAWETGLGFHAKKKKKNARAHIVLHSAPSRLLPGFIVEK